MAPAAQGALAPQQPKKRGIIGLWANRGHALAIDHRLHQPRFEPPRERFIRDLSPVGLRPPWRGPVRAAGAQREAVTKETGASIHFFCPHAVLIP